MKITDAVEVSGNITEEYAMPQGGYEALCRTRKGDVCSNYGIVAYFYFFLLFVYL